jgi:hypothetical protein
MDVRLWTVSSCVMAGLSFGYLPNYALLCNALAFCAHSDKYMDTALHCNPSDMAGFNSGIAGLLGFGNANDSNPLTS